VIGAPGQASPLGPARTGGRHRVVALLGAVAAVAVLAAADRGALATPPLTSLDDLRSWLIAVGGVEAGFAVLRLLALAGASYLVVAIALDGLARCTRARPVRRAAELATFPALRRLLTGLAGASFATVVALPGGAVPNGAVRGAVAPDGGAASATGPAATSGARMVLIDGGDPEERDPEDPGRDDPGPAAGPAPGGRAGEASGTSVGTATMRWLPPDDGPAVGADPAEAEAEPGRPGAAVSPTPSTTTWALSPGEHLWYVAETHLAESWGRPGTDAEIASYWVALVERNRPALPDPANPDLVYPGFVVDLPPVTAPPPPDRSR